MGSCRCASTRRTPLHAPGIPAPLQRSAMQALPPRLTSRQTCRTPLKARSILLARARERRGSGVRCCRTDVMGEGIAHERSPERGRSCRFALRDGMVLPAWRRTLRRAGLRALTHGKPGAGTLKWSGWVDRRCVVRTDQSCIAVSGPTGASGEFREMLPGNCWNPPCWRRRTMAVLCQTTQSHPFREFHSGWR